MSLREKSRLRAAAIVGGLAIVLGVFANSQRQAVQSAPPRSEIIVPLFAKTEAAQNRTKMMLLADARQVVGWISGPNDYKGKSASVTMNGNTQQLPIGEGNFFRWNYNVDKPTKARFAFDDFEQTLTLQAQKWLEPVVFFATDRSAYMPNHKLQFAAYLRRMDNNGAWQPMPNRTVEVIVTGQKRRNVAAKISLTSDAAGRIAGSYQWSEGDVLDTYDVSIPGFRGAAQVTLAEFRKSKIRLKVGSERANDKMQLKFEALNFLDKPVPGGKVHFTAQVVALEKPAAQWTLRGADFAYAETENNPLPNAADLSEDESLLAEAEPRYLPQPRFVWASWQAPVAEISGDVDAADGKGEHSLDLKPEWLDGRYEVRVQAVLVDPNGHEQRATHNAPLGNPGKKLHLQIAKRHYAPGEAIKITALTDNGKTPAWQGASIVAMRLSSTQGTPAIVPVYNLNFQTAPVFGSGVDLRSSLSGFSRRALWRQPITLPAPIQRTLATATAFAGNTATLNLNEPGAYKLIAVGKTADGQTLREEVGCVVRDGEDGPALVLNLDKDEFSGGEAISGVLHSRFAGAKVLLTLRDSSGFQLWQPFTVTGGMARFSLTPPANLNYGCTLEAQYLENDMKVHAASKWVRVVPAARLLKIETKIKPEYEPGEKAKIEIAVNRREAVDLIVAVYDKSLLGVAPDRSKNAPDFFLADERGGQDAQRDLLRRRLAGVTVEKLVAHAQELLAERKEKQPVAPDGAVVQDAETAQLQNLVNNFNGNYLQLNNVITLLQLAGIEAQPNVSYGYWNGRVDKSDKLETPLFDLIEKDNGNYKLNFRFWNDTLVLWTNYAYSNVWNGGFGGGQSFFSLNSAGAVPAMRYSSRGDAWGDRIASANASPSFSASGQAMYSQLQPTQQLERLITLDNNANNTLVRRDFSDVAHWSSLVRTDAEGRASVEFKLPDSLTNWQVVVTAVSPSMSVGQTKSDLRTFKPVMVWPMLPRVFTRGDSVRVFATLHNYSDKAQNITAAIKVENGQVTTPLTQTVRVQPKANAPVYWTFQPEKAGYTQILMSAECAAGSDASLKRLPVVAPAVTEALTDSGFAKNGGTIKVPSGIDLETAELEIGVAPTIAADLADTLDYLVEYPYGCVEQTMSRFLPAIKVAQTLTRLKIEHPGLQKKLPGAVAAGIKRLVELQQPDGGWGWHGGTQTHEMMTPYALYGLLEAEKAGYEIGHAMAVTRGLNRLESFINAMGESQSADRIYCMAVYSNRRDVKAEWWNFIEGQLDKNKLSDYALALSLEMAVRGGKKELAKRLANALHASAKRQGGLVWWTRAGFSRWGDDANEVTAVAMKALVAHDANDPLIEGILSYFAENKRGNRWNSTKDTAMIVFALCDYLGRQKEGAQSGQTLMVSLNGGAARELPLADGLMKKVTIPGTQLQRGENAVRFTGAGAGTLYRLVLRYTQEGRSIAPHDSGLEVRRQFYLLNEKGKRIKEIAPGETVPRGSYIESEVDTQSEAGGTLRYVLVENPKPASCEILPADDARFNQQGSPVALREDRTALVAFHHETSPATLKDRCILHAEMAGEFLVPPARAEMMYRTQTRGHSGTFHFKVAD
jgi:uncharacterized protein YfaS (alpha-2-macroglobulin family)